MTETMTDGEAMTALRTLLDERQRYEGWIQALDEHRRSSPPHVYERVRADYVARFDSVVQRLAEHADQLREKVDSLASQLALLKEREDARAEARQEAELRAMVGEYSEEEWTQIRDQADQEIGQIVSEREAVEVELAELQHIISMSTPSDNMPASASAPPGSAQADGTRSVPEVTAEPAEASDSPTPRRSAAEQSVASTPLFSAQEPVGAAGESQAAIAAALKTDPSTEMRRDQEKTLICPECSAANYATEWYCERCGGELATY